MSSSKNPISRAVQRATQIFRNPPAAPVQTPGQNPGAPLPRATSFPGGYKVENARIVAIYKTFIGEFTPPTFRDAVTAFRTDGDIFNAVNFIGNAALSPGFYCTGDADYEGGDALALVEEFNRSILWGGNKFSERGLAGLMRIFSRELVYGGNTFLEMITPDALYKLQQVQIATIWKLNRDEFGNVREIWQKVGGIPYQLEPDNIIHIPFLTINREAVGVGILEPMLEPGLSANGETIAPLWILKASVTYDIARMLHRRVAPHSVFNFPEAGDEELEKYEQAMVNPAVDASFFTNLDPAPSILTEEAGRFQGVQALLEYFNARVQSTLQTPINMLVTSSGYTEASARVAKELGGLIIADLQQRIKDAVENELYTRILKQAGYDPERAKIELHWGLPSQPVFTLTEISKLFDQKAISLYEYREFMRDLGLKVKDDSEFEDDLNEQTKNENDRNPIPVPGAPGSNPLLGQNTVVGKPHAIPTPNNVPAQKNAQIAKRQVQERVFSVEDSSRPEHNEKMPARFEKEHIMGRQNWREETKR